MLPRTPPLRALPLTAGIPRPLPPLRKCAFRNCHGTSNDINAGGLLNVAADIRYITNIISCMMGVVRHSLLPGCPGISNIIKLGRLCNYNITVGTPTTIIPVHAVRGVSLGPGFNNRMVIVNLNYRGLRPRHLLAKASSIRTVPMRDTDVIDLRSRGRINFRSVIRSVLRITRHRLRGLGRHRQRAYPTSRLIINVRYNNDSTFSNMATGPTINCTSSLLIHYNTAIVFSRIARIHSTVRLLAPHTIGRRINGQLLRRVR